MTTFFFYGTLRHLPLLEVVLGRRPETREAVLKGHAVKAVPGETYPTITAVPGAEAPGLLVSGLAAEDIARLDYYEGGHGYETRQVAVGGPRGTAAAQVYFPDAAGAPDAAPWSLAGWVTGVGASRGTGGARGHGPARALLGRGRRSHAPLLCRPRMGPAALWPRPDPADPAQPAQPGRGRLAAHARRLRGLLPASAVPAELRPLRRRTYRAAGARVLHRTGTSRWCCPTIR
ncbi:gamma-glutamylcyclotransferase family protein [Ponticoccus litoralis]|uniref:Putative gamma-glutamylcyclotransferase n=1 Tax=Ponticoccus litoralis TaxID=422297 RepID=A0AAW9SHF5_9RHOB